MKRIINLFFWRLKESVGQRLLWLSFFFIGPMVVHIALASRGGIQVNPVVHYETAPAIQPLALMPWKIPFWLVPSVDGDSLFVFTDQTTEVSADVKADVRIGGGARISIGMSFNDSENNYEGGFSEILTPGTSVVEGDVGLTAELTSGDTLDTGDIPFRRFFVPTASASPVISEDNLLEMIFSDNALPADAYIVVMTTNNVPGLLPFGHHLIGQSYTVRASGAIVNSDKPLYTNTTLSGFDPHLLSIFQWNPVVGAWENIGGSLDDLIEQSVVTTTGRFTIYALVTTTQWKDNFSDFTGTEEYEGTDILVGSSELVLDGLSLSGFSVSRLITPTVPIKSWGTLTYTRTVPSGTSLTVDILDAENTPLFTNVSSYFALSSLDPAQYPSLKLRANLSTNNTSISPSLEEWAISWQPSVNTIYLPYIMRP